MMDDSSKLVFVNCITYRPQEIVEKGSETTGSDEVRRF